MYGINCVIENGIFIKLEFNYKVCLKMRLRDADF